jgi:hypothetical protein
MTGSSSQCSPPHISTSNTSYDGQSSPLASRNGESSATSTYDFVDPPSLQAFRKKGRKPYSDYPPPISSTDQVPEAQRYWNEYDHPEDEETGGYYIYVDPDAQVKFPGQETIQAWLKKSRRILGLGGRADNASLLSGADDASSDDDDSVVESPQNRMGSYGAIASRGRKASHDGYFSNLFRSLRDPQRDAKALQERRSLLSELETRQHKTEMTKLRFYSTCLATAIAIDCILGLMTVTSRKRERGAVDMGVFFGTICTLVLCVVAIISMKTRNERLGWLHQGAVMSIAGAVVGLDVVLLLWVLRI